MRGEEHKEDKEAGREKEGEASRTSSTELADRKWVVPFLFSSPVVFTVKTVPVHISEAASLEQGQKGSVRTSRGRERGSSRGGRNVCAEASPCTNWMVALVT